MRKASKSRGSRCSVARAYIYGRNRPNLHVITDATVLRVTFDGKRAAGVAVARNGRVETPDARAEVDAPMTSADSAPPIDAGSDEHARPSVAKHAQVL